MEIRFKNQWRLYFLFVFLNLCLIVFWFSFLSKTDVISYTGCSARPTASPLCTTLLLRHDISEALIDCFHNCCITDHKREYDSLHCIRACEVESHLSNHQKSISKETSGLDLRVLGTINFHFVAIHLHPQQKGKLVISYSLYGNDRRFLANIASMIHTAHQIYPEWIIRFYVSIDVPPDVVRTMISMKCEVILTIVESQDLPTSFHGMFWRFFVVNDESVERYLIRDADSYVLQRERDAVTDWIKEGKMFHVMRDHLYHGTEMLGGMWGGIADKNILDMAKIYDSAIGYHQKDGRDHDQAFLRQYIWPIVKHRMTCHASFFFDDIDNGQCHAFPTERKHEEFVGNRDALAH